MKKIALNSVTFWGLVLFLVLLCTIFILPLLRLDLQPKISRFLYTLLYFSAIFSLEKRSNTIIIISLVALCTEWLAGFFSLWLLTTISKSLNIIFFLGIAGILIHQVATSREVNLKVILGSVTGYLLIGMIYSIFIAYIMMQDPEAFNITIPDAGLATHQPHFSESIYFSFISFATVGYGDILPLKPYTRSLAVLISISGQLYIAIIIALLVGKFSAMQHDRHKNHNSQH